MTSEDLYYDEDEQEQQKAPETFTVPSDDFPADVEAGARFEVVSSGDGVIELKLIMEETEEPEEPSNISKGAV